MANASLAPVQLVKNGCFPLVLNLLPDRIDWNGNPPSWPRLVQNKNSSFFTAKSNSPSFHFPGNKRQFADRCGFFSSPSLQDVQAFNQRERFSLTFGWRIVNSTTFPIAVSPLPPSPPELKKRIKKEDSVVFRTTSQKHTVKTDPRKRKMFIKQKEKESKEATLPLPLSPKTVSASKNKK